MANRKVSVIERVKRNGKWVWGEKWDLPLNLTAREKSRRGKFYILWYRGNQKVFMPVPTLKEEKLPELKAALLQAKIKQRHLEDAADGLDRPDPIKLVNRVTIREALQKFATQIELTKDPLTYKVYEQNLRQYSEWTKLSLYATLGIFLLLASRDPSSHRSLIAFAAWSSFAHAAVMGAQAYLKLIARRELFGVATFFLIGVALIALAPAKQPVERATTVAA